MRDVGEQRAEGHEGRDAEPLRILGTLDGERPHRVDGSMPSTDDVPRAEPGVASDGSVVGHTIRRCPSSRITFRA
jgi:hypothetical protein